MAFILAADSGNRYLGLEHGNILLTPDRDILVSAKQGNIYIGSGATVFIMKSGNNVVLYDLVQTKPNQVSVIVNKQKLVMEPGHMLALTNQNIDHIRNMELNTQSVAYRRPQQVLSGNVKAFSADFSISSAMNNIEPLRRLTVSTYKQDQLTIERLWKNAQIEGDFSLPNQPFNNATMGR
ncbi:MAG: hypothetical protein WDN66_04490 [Candidatus Saccharibacteria bacterium]